MPDNDTRDTELVKVVKHFTDFLDVTDENRCEQGTDRDYVDHKQWDADDVEILNARKQAAVVINRIKQKVNFLVGAERQSRTDPKAFPRTPDHEDAADAATDALRFVADNEDFDQVSSSCFADKVTVGTEACIVEVVERGGEFEVAISDISWDRYYYDPYSRRLDFKDKRYDGIVTWLDMEDAIALFPGKRKEIEGAINTTTDSVDGSTFDDQPLWVDRKRKRLRICQHYYKKDSQWHVCIFTEMAFLQEPRPSDYLDEFGEPENPIEAQSLYIDRENNRYGEVRGLRDTQDEINHRRSKALYQLSVRQTVGEKGAVDDVNHAKSELAKADGHVEITPGMNFELLQNQDLTTGQFQLYQDAKAEMDVIGANAALGGDAANLSGRAIQSLQQGGLTELTTLFDGHSAWKRRVYRQVWNRIKQFWDSEKWIRVTDDESNLRWVGLNQPVTLGEALKEQSDRDWETRS